MTMLLSPAEIAGLSLKNRVVMPPMCMYEVHEEDGLPTAFHRAHYGARAISGVGLIIQEATAVEADGRLSNRDLGLWTDEQADALSQMVADLHYLGAQVGVQLGHGGRKAHDALDPIAPSAIGYGADYRDPREMTIEDIERVKTAFVEAAKRADKAGYDMIELHGAHGYLINQFLEPQTNQRKDDYGGSLENRFRFLKEIVEEVKDVFSKPIWIRLSMSAYDETGVQNTIEDYQQIGKWLEELGVACLDISTGGLMDVRPNIPIHGGYQAGFTAKMKEAVSIPVTAVGLLNSPELDEYLLQSGQADLILLGRGLLRNVNWLADAAVRLHDHDFKVYNDSYRRGQVK
ncbi:oxidoreductase [Streptococcus pluranimalium]|uniref:oxidoreductase n=1 Tax=Streptococcus pluranimalium TaxID=82348 RepID=UPI002414DF12|nr:NADH:flavin oxidoreductase/NADH oxidase [Streptococcus pluranimalium]WFM79551.1 NADH:flavin oxidoreductase/NADH oxidase [Streptococcus pluranimalium]HEM6116917.1 NADH:flavin oxidoreductase/NADH oxidase [Streptococcus suis]